MPCLDGYGRQLVAVRYDINSNLQKMKTITKLALKANFTFLGV